MHERNPNQGDWGAIQESIEANGFFGAVVAQKSTRKILAGNHRWKVASNLGYDAIPVVWVDVDDDAAIRILLSDNRTSRLGDDDTAKLAELLSELAMTDRGLSGTGFDGDALDQLISDLTYTPTEAANDPNEEWQGMPEFQQDDLESFRRLIVHFENQEDVDAFAQLVAQNLTDKTKYIWHPAKERNDFSDLEFKSES
jgi:hypothetical protein